MQTRLSLTYWSGDGGPGSPKSPLYGIWNVEQLSVDGVLRSPLLNDYDRRWRRVEQTERRTREVTSRLRARRGALLPTTSTDREARWRCVGSHRS